MSEVRKLILEAVTRLNEASAILRKAGELVPVETTTSQVLTETVTPQTTVTARFGYTPEGTGYAPTAIKPRFNPTNLVELGSELTSQLNCILEGSNYIMTLKKYVGIDNYRTLAKFVVEKYGGRIEGQGKDTRFVIPSN